MYVYVYIAQSRQLFAQANAESGVCKADQTLAFLLKPLMKTRQGNPSSKQRRPARSTVTMKRPPKAAIEKERHPQTLILHKRPAQDSAKTLNESELRVAETKRFLAYTKDTNFPGRLSCTCCKRVLREAHAVLLYKCVESRAIQVHAMGCSKTERANRTYWMPVWPVGCSHAFYDGSPWCDDCVTIIEEDGDPVVCCCRKECGDVCSGASPTSKVPFYSPAKFAPSFRQFFNCFGEDLNFEAPDENQGKRLITHEQNARETQQFLRYRPTHGRIGYPKSLSCAKCSVQLQDAHPVFFFKCNETRNLQVRVRQENGKSVVKKHYASKTYWQPSWRDACESDGCNRCVTIIEEPGAHDPIVLTAVIIKKNGTLQVSITNIGGALLKDISFPLDTTVLDLQATIKSELKPEWSKVTFRSDDNREVKEKVYLRDHDRLSCQGMTNEPVACCLKCAKCDRTKSGLPPITQSERCRRSLFHAPKEFMPDERQLFFSFIRDWDA